MKSKTQRRRSGSSVAWRNKETFGLSVIALCVSATFGCRNSDERARAEMQPVYRSAKLMMERLKAGADFKEFGTLRGNFATELSIVRDHMSARASTKDPLRKYCAAYQDVLELYSFAARVWQFEISLDQCIGPAQGLDWSDEFKAGNYEDGMLEVRAFNAWSRRFTACFGSHHKIIDEIRLLAGSPTINCLECEARPEHGRESDCVFKKAETKLMSAEALLLKH